MIYQFNDFTLDTVKFTLTKADVLVPVEPQVFNIILFLIQQKYKVVSRQELLDTLWQDRVVSDSSISNQIKSARKVLGDDGVNQSVIKTIHGRGYQFIASVKSTDDAESSQKKNQRIRKHIQKSLFQQSY